MSISPSKTSFSREVDDNNHLEFSMASLSQRDKEERKIRAI
jgi:hypothetical protein